MSVLAQNREILRLLSIRQTAAERALAGLMQRKRQLLERRDRYRADAAVAMPASAAPTGGELRATARAAAAWRAEATRCNEALVALQPEIAAGEAALAAVIRKVTALEAIIARLEHQEFQAAEEREDDALLDIVQIRDRQKG